MKRKTIQKRATNSSLIITASSRAYRRKAKLPRWRKQNRPHLKIQMLKSISHSSRSIYPLLKKRDKKGQSMMSSCCTNRSKTKSFH